MTSGNFPITKVQASGGAGAVTLIFVWLMQTYAGVEIPGDVAAAITTILMLLAAYITPLFETEVTPVEVVSGELKEIEPVTEPDDGSTHHS